MSALLLTAALAAATSPSPQADELFSRARTAMAQKDYPHACALFEQSHAAEPALGTLLNLAECREKQGRVASAWLRFNEAASWAARNKEARREEFAQRHASALKPALQYLVLKAEKLPPGAKLAIDAEAPADAAVDVAMPIDPGAHHLTASAAGFKPLETTIEFNSPGASRTWRLDFASDAPVEAMAVVPWVAPAPPPLVQVVDSPVHSRRVPGLLAATGATLIGAGAVGLSYTFIRYNAYQRQQIGGPDASNPTVSRNELSTMSTLYPLSWVATGVGAAVVGGSLYMLFHEPSRPSVALVPGEHGVSVALSGEF
jgi:hypothetical protein